MTGPQLTSVPAPLETGHTAMPTNPRPIFLGSAQAGDLEAIRRLLESASLPSEDVSESLLQHFLVGRIDDQIAGVVGLELYEDMALLRALVVAEEHSSVGFGKGLVAAAEQLAADMAIKSIYLLTTTADRFFEHLGFRRLPRDLAPLAIKGSHQFASLCPASAVLMVKP
jgi:amino-acid N-acetyltransferase